MKLPSEAASRCRPARPLASVPLELATDRFEGSAKSLSAADACGIGALDGFTTGLVDNSKPRIKSPSGIRSQRYMSVRVAGQLVCVDSREPVRTVMNCNPNCNRADPQRPKVTCWCVLSSLGY